MNSHWLLEINGMRKATKSALYKLFNTTTKDVHVAQLHIVFDGGLLLHKVIWQRDAKISTICESYIHLIMKNYRRKRCTVVFGGYSSSTSSTKVAEKQSRYWLRKSADIHFTEESEINVKQEDFLTNKFNKSRLINMLKVKLEDNGIMTLQAERDDCGYCSDCGYGCVNVRNNSCRHFGWRCRHHSPLDS